MLRLARLLRARHTDDGVALPTVFGIGMVMMIMIAVSMSAVTSGLNKTRTDENWNAALNAAQAGVQEYQSRLSNDSTYWRYGNPASLFSRGSDGIPEVVAPPAGRANPAFGIGGSWANVEGSQGRAQYRYEVNTDRYQAQGKLQLRATGRVGSTTRSIVVDLKQDGFINWLYFTGYEVQDPQFTGKAFCADRYAYGLNARPLGSDANECAQIQFGRVGAPDVFDGPVHSNDMLYICNAEFRSAVTSTATPTRATRAGTCTGGTPPSAVTYAPAVVIPQTNATDRRQTFIDDAEVARPGCLYTGPTKITFSMVGGVAKMNIVSPWTKVTNPRPGELSGVSKPECGNVAAMHTSAGSTVDALDSNLMFVQNVPTNTSNVNGWASGTTPNWSGTAVVCGTDASMGGWTFGTHKYPITNEFSPEGSSTSAVAYGCRNGDAYVQGVVGSAVTVSSENYVYVMGDVTNPAGIETAMTGLIGNNGVIVYNPVSASQTTCRTQDNRGNCTAWNYGAPYTALLGSSGTNRTIHGALMSVQHTIQVQNYSRVARGTLTVVGSMAQKYRGPTGTSGSATTGYTKAYSYDKRFLSTAPPKFLTPTSTTYGITQTATTPTAYRADGSSTGR